MYGNPYVEKPNVEDQDVEPPMNRNCIAIHGDSEFRPPTTESCPTMADCIPDFEIPLTFLPVDLPLTHPLTHPPPTAHVSLKACLGGNDECGLQGGPRNHLAHKELKA